LVGCKTEQGRSGTNLFLKLKFMIEEETKYYLSTEGYYFVFREDRNDPRIKRATLFSTNPNRMAAVDDVRVREGYGLPEKSIHQVINHFESRLYLKQIE
jgi:hypothetical protein